LEKFVVSNWNYGESFRSQLEQSFHVRVPIVVVSFYAFNPRIGAIFGVLEGFKVVSEVVN
jgi:hypothetical protein